MPDKYVKTLEINLDYDRYKEQAKKLNSIRLVNDKDKEAFTELLAKESKYAEQLEFIKQALKDIENFKGPDFKKLRKELVDEMKKTQDDLDNLHRDSKVQRAFKEGFTKLLDSIGKFTKHKIGNFIDDVLDEAKSMLNKIASYSENSSIYSQEATNLKLNYGLTGAKAYAYQMAAEKTGFGSFEGYLENVWFATDETKERFNTLVKKYEESYERDKKTAEAFQQLKTDWSDFKTDMGMQIISWFKENKTEIMNGFRTLLSITKAILTVLSSLMSIFSTGRQRTQSEHEAAVSDILNNNRTTNNNVSVDMTFNNVDPSKVQTYQEAGQIAYRQLIAAIK